MDSPPKIPPEIPHDSAALYVTGAAQFTDDIAFPTDGVHIALGLSAQAHAEIIACDFTAVLAHKGVITILTTADILGRNDASPVAGDDPIFAESRVEYHGQAIFAVVAKSAKQARQAAQKAVITYEELPACITIDDALAQESLLEPPYTITRGDVDSALANAPHQLAGQIDIGGQEHFYLEGQAAVAIPGEGKDMHLYVSTQHPTEIQHKTAAALGVNFNAITVEVRRMGGGFGGKESQANLPAIIAALGARKTGRAAKLVYDRDEDMRVTGKRHDMRIAYRVGYDDAGRILALDVDQSLRCGMSFDLSQAVAERAMLHAENCYYIENTRITSRLCKTHTPSNTAFRGFGGPQGMLGMERIIDEIAARLDMDAVALRQKNYYADYNKNAAQKTPYGQVVKDGLINAITRDLLASSDYTKRRAAIDAFNQTSAVIKRGIGFAPVKFGISFNKTMLNQGGALLHIYTDGSVHLNHGGTEMGQGLYTKVRQICADAFGIDDALVKITATSTGKVPNTSATAASSGTDLNGMATAQAAAILKTRMAEYLAPLYQADPEKVRFAEGKIWCGDAVLGFAEAAEMCWQGRVSLSTTGFYATPEIHWDRTAGKGAPFYYFAYGAAVCEVAVDVLTGENIIKRVDVLHDAGASINPAIDKGQIEGGLVQGLGWLTTEEVVYGEEGALLTHAPSTYKIPACSDRPRDLRLQLYDSGGNLADTIHKSKAVGEPPLMLAISVYGAVSHALQSLGGGYPYLNTPMTPEQILRTAERLKRREN